MNKHELNGKVDQAKGKLKVAIGTVTKDENLKTEGHVDEAVGQFESAVGSAQRKAVATIDKVTKAVKR
jgi:uncharacterized protein YjbJ (UPF0337 family)